MDAVFVLVVVVVVEAPRWYGLGAFGFKGLLGTAKWLLAVAEV